MSADALPPIDGATDWQVGMGHTIKPSVGAYAVMFAFDDPGKARAWAVYLAENVARATTGDAHG